MSEHLPNRKQLPKGVHIDLGQPTIVFVNLCTEGRSPWLASREVQRCLVDVWSAASKWTVGRYVLMPDHLHLFAAPADLEFSLDAWVRFWKSQFTKGAGRAEWRWQTGHWDRRMRRSESYAEKWEYVRSNPVRAGLVKDTDDRPYQGEQNVLPW